MAFVANPKVTFNITTNNALVGPDDQRALIVGQMTTGTAIAGSLTVDVAREDAGVNAAFGANSMLALIARGYREVNKITNVDALPMIDNVGGTAATASIAFVGTATAAGTYFVTLVSDENYKYQLDGVAGDTAAGLVTKALAAIAADRYQPFTWAGATGTLTLTAVNKGSHANDWPLIISGNVPGITYTLTGWAGGATNPTLTTLFDPIQTLRYQTIIWPGSYDVTKVKTLLESRKNVDNNIMDGMAFTYQNSPFGTIKTTASTTNSSEIVFLWNEPTSALNWKGPHLPEAPDVVSAKLCAALDRRLEDGVSISDIVATNAPLDQFGGIHTHSLPVFNTPMIGVGLPLKGTGASLPEQLELEGAGVSITGVNRQFNAVVMSVAVTSYLNDPAGNIDATWQFVEWRRTHGAIREFFQRNCQKQFRQNRLTSGTAVAGFSMADEASIRAFCLLLYQQLAQVALTVEGNNARSFFDRNLKVTLVPGKRQVKISSKVPMMSQLGVIIGSLEYSFEHA